LASRSLTGPYKVKKELSKGSYVLEEVDGTELKRNYAASHIKQFFPRGRALEDIQKEELDPEENSQSEGEEEDPEDQDQDDEDKADGAYSDQSE
jgi:hypothetical protein